MKKKIKKESKASLHKKAWKLWSICVRKTQSNFQGKTPCYTCGVLFDWKTLQAGHFRHDCFDFDEMNVKAQCKRCNHFLRGNLAQYTIHLMKDYGQERVEKFMKLKKWNDYKISWLKRIIEKCEEILTNV